MNNIIFRKQQMYEVKFTSRKTNINFSRYLVLNEDSDEEIKKLLMKSLIDIKSISIKHIHPVFSLINTFKHKKNVPNNQIEEYWIDGLEIITIVYCKKSTISFSMITDVDYSEKQLYSEIKKYFNDVLRVEIYKWNECWIKKNSIND